MHHLGLGWQLARHLFLGATQQEGPHPGGEVVEALGVTLALDGRAVVLVEALLVAQPAGHQEMEDRPQLAQIVFHWRTGQAQALVGVQFASSLGGLAGTALDVLRFVQHQQVPVLCLQMLKVTWQQGVGGQHQVVVAKRGERA